MTVRPLWRRASIFGVFFTASVALALLVVLLRWPTTVIHLERDTTSATDATGTLCHGHSPWSCHRVTSSDGSVNPASATVFSRPDVMEWVYGSREHSFDYSGGGVPLVPAVLGLVAVTACSLAWLRRAVVRLVRIGRELRLETGRDIAVMMRSEVRAIDIDSASAVRHGLVFVLEDGRRIAMGKPRLRMSDTLKMQRHLRAALDLRRAG